jgi:transposase-like protein
VEDVRQVVKSGVLPWLHERLRLFADLLMNTEIAELAGKRNERNPDRDCVRWGHQDGSVFLLEQRVPVKKPRVRTAGVGSEVELETYAALNDRQFLTEQAAAKLLSGLSTRNLGKTLEPMLRGRGIGRQTISQRGIDEMSKQLEEFQSRSLAGVDILVVFADGIHLGDDVLVAAVGIDSVGKRHVLDFEPGSTESSGVCRTLFSRLIERGILREEGGYLFVVDGGPGLRKAIRDAFGNRVSVQRCVVHKKRNVTDKLPKYMHKEFNEKFNAAYGQKTVKAAEKRLVKLRDDLILQRRHGAAGSLLEGMQEILTLHRLEITGVLRRSLYTTNCIESVFSSARYYSRNVKRWRNEQQMQRWLASGLLEAEKRLKRAPGYTQLPKLKAALRMQKKAK